jgi:hypothetical protein
MARVRNDRRQVFLPEYGPGRRSTGVLVLLMVGVLAAIAFIWNFARQPSRRAPAPTANVEPAASPAPVAAAAAPAVSPAPADEGAGDARNQAAIARVVGDGRPGLKDCYQRALVRDDSLVHGKVTVRVSIAASGRVDTVNVAGPAAFRALAPCFETAISRWTFPAAPAPYTTEFPVVLQGRQ